MTENAAFHSWQPFRVSAKIKTFSLEFLFFPYLHRKFVELGRQRNRLLNEMLAILPEIYESGVWRKYAETIIEYAGKFGGISKSAVLKRLRLEKYLIDKPALKEAIKTAGVNKVAMVAAIATSQTDKAFADKVENMSKSAIEMLSKELRAKADPTVISPCGLYQ